MSETVFYWDFFGPDAQGTAEHFRRHLEELIRRERLAGCATGLVHPGPGHVAVSCRAPAASAEAMRRALRPRREESAQ